MDAFARQGGLSKMKLVGQDNFRHGEAETVGVLLANLGTPDAPTAPALRRYLAEFLGDPRVVEAPRWLWLSLLRLWILPRRAPRSAAAYARVWTDEGSPLLVYSRAQADALREVFARENAPVRVALGMRYGAPSLESALDELRGCGRLAVFPLYPQRASATTGTVFAEVARVMSSWRDVPPTRFIAGYADDPRYISVLAESIAAHWRENGRAEMILFSFHGVPKAMLLAGDPYHCLCLKTARLTAEALGLRADEWMAVFQSRFGRAEWLRPYADEVLRGLPSRGVRDVQVACPAFSADCLETLEEIAMENRELFLASGGEKFGYIPALNASESHIKFLREVLEDNIGDWLRGLRRENAKEIRGKQKTLAENRMREFGGD